MSKKLAIDNWFYEAVWLRSSSMSEKERNSLCYLLFIDDIKIGLELVKILGNHNSIYVIKKGNSYSYNKDENTYTISPNSRDDYVKLFNHLKSCNIKINHIVHLWLLDILEEQHEVTIDSINHYQSLGFYSLLYTIQELAKNQIQNSLVIDIIANGLYSITGEEELSPEKATIQGLITCIPQEYTGIRSRYIDINTNTNEKEKLIKNLVNEITSKVNETQIAYRNNLRWVKNYEAIQTSAEGIPDVLKQNGTYLLTGGLGNIGLVFAEYLVENVKANLVLIGRAVLPKREDWENYLASPVENGGIVEKLRRIKKIESLGGKVITISADVSDKKQMQKAFNEAISIFGRINGIFHLAGATREEGLAYISDMNSMHLEYQLKPKANGLLVLNDLIKKLELNLDFVFVSSSLSVTLGGIKLSAYVGANAFMDIFGQKQAKSKKCLWFTPNWEGSDPEEIKEPLCRILSMQNIPLLVMSITNLDYRIKQWIKMENFNRENDKTQLQTKLYSRPELNVQYEAPRDEIERKVEACWQEVLGIEDIGINDNFFDLGGNSLSGLFIVAKIKEQFGIDYSIVDIFNFPTIEQTSLKLSSIIKESDFSISSVEI